jgi:flagellar basal body-associated protein FliL
MKQNSPQKKKSMIMRIIVLSIAVAMVLGFIAMPLLRSF